MKAIDTVKEAQSLVNHMLQHRVKREGEWRNLQKWICPARGLLQDQDKNFHNPENIVRFTHAASSATLRGASGMTSGMTPRNAAWFKPDFAEAEVLEVSGARAWLDEVAKRMRDCLANGGFYQAIHSFNMDLLWAGCALLYSEKGTEFPLHFQCYQIGTFCVETDRHGQLLAVARRLAFTLQELVEEFGEENIAQATLAQAKQTPWQTEYVWQLVRLDSNGDKPVSSKYWQENHVEMFLRQDGFFEMPFFYTCWHESNNVYGIGPGDEALPDIRQIDIMEKRKLEGLAKITDPPVQADKAMKDIIDLSPGAINFVHAQQLVKPIIDLSPFAHAFAQLREELQTVQARLEKTLYASIFTSIPLDQRPKDMSATEFVERKREALQQLGPVVSAYEPNVLTPLLYRVLLTLDRRGLMPPVPAQLAGMNLLMKMEFISPMANALRQTDADTTRALVQDVANFARATNKMEVLDKVDWDQVVDELAKDLGCPGSIIRADSDVEEMRVQRAQAQMMQQQMAQETQAAQAEEASGRALNQQAQAAQTFMDMAEAENG